LPQPADPGRQALECDLFPGQFQPAQERFIFREETCDQAMSAGSPESAAQRKGPLPSQKRGRI
jgi:hypothetical protein